MVLSAVIRGKRAGNHGREHAEFEFAVARYGARLRDKTTLLIVENDLRGSFACAKLCAHLLDLRCLRFKTRGKGSNLFLLLHDRGLEVLL